MARPSEITTAVLGRLGLKVEEIRSKTIKIQGTPLTANRVRIHGADWIHLQSTSAVSLTEALKANRLIAALFQRLPALAVLKGREIDYVRMPPWAFAALVRMALECNPKSVETVLTDYLPLGPAIPQMDLEIGSSAVFALERDARVSSSEPSTS